MLRKYLLLQVFPVLPYKQINSLSHQEVIHLLKTMTKCSITRQKASRDGGKGIRLNKGIS